jgi:hypothetical protein
VVGLPLHTHSFQSARRSASAAQHTTRAAESTPHQQRNIAQRRTSLTFCIFAPHAPRELPRHPPREKKTSEKNQKKKHMNNVFSTFTATLTVLTTMFTTSTSTSASAKNPAGRRRAAAFHLRETKLSYPFAR